MHKHGRKESKNIYLSVQCAMSHCYKSYLWVPKVARLSSVHTSRNKIKRFASHLSQRKPTLSLSRHQSADTENSVWHWTKFLLALVFFLNKWTLSFVTKLHCSQLFQGSSVLFSSLAQFPFLHCPWTAPGSRIRQNENEHTWIWYL